MFATSQHAHFIGIGGIGMSGIAEILLNLGMKVSGSDLRRGPVTDRLAQLGATIYEGHDAGNVAGATVVVTSSAVGATNPEVVEAHARKIPVIQRAEMLAELMRLKYGIAIAGMHGKTTTTSMVASVLAAGGLDPTVVVGGRVDALGSNARLGTTQYLVAEADESDRSFLKLSPILAVVTNLDREHMDCYRDMADVERAFLEFMDRVPFYGAVTACIDNPLLKAILPRVRRRVFTYGVAAEADYRLEFLERSCPRAASRASSCTPPPDRSGPSSSTFPAATTCSTPPPPSPSPASLKFPPKKSPKASAIFAASTAAFSIAARPAASPWSTTTATTPPRFAPPSPPPANAATARSTSSSSPTGTPAPSICLDQFGGAFTDADTVIVLPIYAASEEPIPGVTAENLAAKITGPRRPIRPRFPAAVAAVAAQAHAGDLILTLGAGNVSQLAPKSSRRYSERLAENMIFGPQRQPLVLPKLKSLRALSLIFSPVNPTDSPRFSSE